MIQFGTTSLYEDGIAHVHGIRFEGSGAGANCVGVKFTAASEPSITQCEFNNIPKYGVQISTTNSSHWSYIQGTFFVNPSASGAAGIFIDGGPVVSPPNGMGSELHVLNCFFSEENGNRSAITVTNQAWFNLKITDNRFLLNSAAPSSAIDIGAGNQIFIANNVFRWWHGGTPIIFQGAAAATNINSFIGPNLYWNTNGAPPLFTVGANINGVRSWGPTDPVNSNFGLNTNSPQATLHVNGGAIFEPGGITNKGVTASSIIRTDANQKEAPVTVGTGLSFDGTTLSATAGGGGNVIGPTSSTVSEVALYNNTSGTLLTNSPLRVTQAGTVTGASTLTASNSVSSSNLNASVAANLNRLINTNAYQYGSTNMGRGTNAVCDMSVGSPQYATFYPTGQTVWISVVGNPGSSNGLAQDFIMDIYATNTPTFNMVGLLTNNWNPSAFIQGSNTIVIHFDGNTNTSVRYKQDSTTGTNTSPYVMQGGPTIISPTFSGSAGFTGLTTVSSNFVYSAPNLWPSSNNTNHVIDCYQAEYLIQATNDLSFQMSTNRPSVNKVSYISITIEAGSTNRLLTFNSSWKWLGNTNNPPTSLASNKVAVLALKIYGTSETNVVAGYNCQP